MARRAAMRSPILIWETKGNPWVDFLMVIMASGIARGRVSWVAQHGDHTPNNALTEICSLGLLYFFDIGHPCYDQLTPIKTRYPLTSITWPYRGLKFKCFFFKLTADQVLVFSIGSWAHVWLTCWKQGRIVRKPVKIITFLQYKCFCCFVLCIWWLLKLKTEDQTIYRKPQRKVRKRKSIFYFFLG